MFKVPMTRDIKDFSPKVISIFNKRQLICSAIALSYGFPVIMYARGLELNTRMTLATILMLPVLACGWIRVYGMPLERFALLVIVNHLLTPTRRMYATENTLDYVRKDKVVLFRGAKRKKKTWKEKKVRRLEMKKYGGVR